MKTIDVAAGDGVLRTRVVGSGKAIVFVHGALVDGHLWDAVVALLSQHYTCVVPDLPLGSHTLPLPPGADRSPAGQARRIADLIDTLKLREVTLVGNDSGGAICQLVAADHPEHLARLVLTNCDAFEVFPPWAYAYLAWACRRPLVMGLLARLMNALPVLARLPNAYGWLAQTRLDGALLESWLRPALDPAIRIDVAGFFQGAGPDVTLGAAERLRSFHKPVLLAWGTNDPFFPLSLAERLAQELPDARIVRFDSACYVPLDQPAALAQAISAHVTMSAPVRATLSA